LSTLAWSFFFSLWGKEGKGVTGFWTFSVEEGDEESLGDEGSIGSFS